MTIFDSVRMKCRTLLEAVNELFTMGGELEQKVDNQEEELVNMQSVMGDVQAGFSDVREEMDTLTDRVDTVEQTYDPEQLNTIKGDIEDIEDDIQLLTAGVNGTQSRMDDVEESNAQAVATVQELSETVATYDSEIANLKTTDTNTMQQVLAQGVEIDNEVTARTNGDTALRTSLDTEIQTRSDQVNTLTTNLNNEVTARTNADTTMQGALDTLDESVVKLAGAQTIAGQKTFEKIPVLSDWNQIAMGRTNPGWRKVATITTTEVGNNVYNALVEVNRTYNFIGGVLQLRAQTTSEGMTNANAMWLYAHDIELEHYVMVYDTSTNTADFWVYIQTNFSGCSIRCVDQFNRSDVEHKNEWKFIANPPIEENITSTGVQVVSMKPTSYEITDTADNSDGIATTKWCNTASTLVHTTGSETIAGVKTFTNNMYLDSVRPELVFYTDVPAVGTLPDSAYYGKLSFRDVDTVERASITYNTASSGNSNIRLVTHNYNGVSAEMRLQVDADGSKYAVAPATRTTGYTTNDIATAGWVDAKLQALEARITALEGGA